MQKFHLFRFRYTLTISLSQKQPLGEIIKRNPNKSESITTSEREFSVCVERTTNRFVEYNQVGLLDNVTISNELTCKC